MIADCAPDHPLIVKFLTRRHDFVAVITILVCVRSLLESSLHLHVRMASRIFVDAEGRTWRVWSTIPGGRSVLRSEFAGGWLTFESGEERRRLAPIPVGWESASETQLASFSRAAQEAPRVVREAVLSRFPSLSGGERHPR